MKWKRKDMESQAKHFARKITQATGVNFGASNLSELSNMTFKCKFQHSNVNSNTNINKAVSLADTAVTLHTSPP